MVNISFAMQNYKDSYLLADCDLVFLVSLVAQSFLLLYAYLTTDNIRPIEHYNLADQFVD